MEISVKELSKMIENGDAPLVIDVREAHELQVSSLPFTTHIPINELGTKIGEFSQDVAIIFMCRTGSRSHWATQALTNAGYKNIKNLVGGINEWARVIDKSIKIY